MISLKVWKRFLGVLGLNAAFAFLWGCENPLRESIETKVAETQAPTATLSNANFLARSSTITISFDAQMDASTLNVEGSLAEDIGSLTWSDEKTLVIVPVSEGWTVGSGKSLTVNAKDTSGWDAQTITKTYGVLDKVIYLSDATGSDNNPGTPDLPVRSLYRAFGIRWTLYDGEAVEIRVSSGTYTLDTFGFDYLLIDDSVTITGGWDTDWQTRDPINSITEFFSTTTTASGSVGVYISDDIDVFLDGVTINPGSASGPSIGISLSQGRLVLQDCIIEMSSSTGIVSGIDMEDGSTLTMSGGSIDCFSSAYTAEGITVDENSSSAVIDDVVIGVRSASATANAFGINSEIPLTLTNNTVNVTNSGGGNAYALRIAPSALVLTGSTVKDNWFETDTQSDSWVVYMRNETGTSFDRNTVISTGSSASTIGVFCDNLQGLDFSNNIVFGGQGDDNLGIFFGYTSTGTFLNNTIHGGDASLGSDPTTITVYLASYSESTWSGNLLLTSDPNSKDAFMIAFYFGSGASAVLSDLNACSGQSYFGIWSDSTNLTMTKATMGISHSDLTMETAPIYMSSPGLNAPTASEYPLSPTSETPASITQSSLSEAPTTDRYGTGRTSPYTLGAVEYE